MLLTLTFYIDGAPAGQHHYVGWRTGGSWCLHCCSYGRAAGSCSAGGGVGGACVGVTYNHCREEIKHLTSNLFVCFFKNLSRIDAVPPSLFPVSAGNRREAFWLAVALATALAVTVKAVWGTSLGINGTSRRPSMLHSDELFGPDMLKKMGLFSTETLVFKTTNPSPVVSIWETTSLSLEVAGYCKVLHMTNDMRRLFTYWYAMVVRRSSLTALRTSARWRSVEILGG